MEVEGGGKACFNRRERPQLLFRNKTPIAMCTAVEEASKSEADPSKTQYRQFTLCSGLEQGPLSVEELD